MFNIISMDITFESKEHRIMPSRSGSNALFHLFERRKKEITFLLTSGKVVFCFLSPVEGILAENRDIGDFQSLNNYSWLPNHLMPLRMSIMEGEGDKIVAYNAKHELIPYYRAFKENLRYLAYLEMQVHGNKRDDKETAMINRTGNPVAFTIASGNGIIHFVPYPQGAYDEKRLLGVIIQCAKRFLTNDIKTEEPDWVKIINVPGENQFDSDILQLEKDMSNLQEQKETIEIQRQELIDYKGLLYEQGKPLEDIAIKSLRLIGFEAEGYAVDDMEHDIVLQSIEGRAICEVEGKDNQAINIDKLDQLNRVIDEDFNLHGTYPEGILIGNPFRLSPLNQRKDPFTDKIKIAAVRKKFGLLTTVELFKAVTKVLENPQDGELKKKVRIALLNSNGAEIKFQL